MIAAVSIFENRFMDGFVRGSEEKLDINDTGVKWRDKWSVVLYRNVLTATSFRQTKNGSNTISFELSLDGVAKLFLERDEGGRELISESRAFMHQESLDGVLFLVYNRNGYRSAFFHSQEFTNWKKDHEIGKVIRRNPSEYQIRDKRPSPDSRALRVGRFEVYVSGKMTVITDSGIQYTDIECNGGKSLRYVSAIGNPKWILLEKIKGSRIERVLVTEEPICELDLPKARYVISHG